MNQSELKQKIIIMKEKSENYDKLLFNFKILEEKYNNILKKYNIQLSNIENNKVGGELAIITHNNYLLKNELNEIQNLCDFKNNEIIVLREHLSILNSQLLNKNNNLLNNNLVDKNMNIFSNLHNNQHTDEINKLKNNYDNRISIFENVIEKHKKRNNMLVDNLERHLDIVKELKQQTEKNKNDLENKNNYITSLIGEIDDFKGNLGYEKDNIKYLKTDINNLELDIEKKEIIIGELSNNNKNLIKLNDDLLEDKCDLIEDINKQRSLIIILDEKNKKLLNETTELFIYINSQTSNYEVLLDEKNKLFNDNKKLKEETEELQSYNINFIEQLTQKENLILVLENDNKRLLDENNYKNNLMTENNELFVYINSLNNKVQKISEYNEIYLNELEDTKKLIEIQKNEINELNLLKIENKQLQNEIQQNNINNINLNSLDWENINQNDINININVTENDINNNIDFINSLINETNEINETEKQTNEWTFIN